MFGETYCDFAGESKRKIKIKESAIMKIWIESSWFGLLFLLFSSSSVVMGHYHIHDDIFSTNIDPRTAAAAEGVAGKDFNLTNLQVWVIYICFAGPKKEKRDRWRDINMI